MKPNRKVAYEFTIVADDNVEVEEVEAELRRQMELVEERLREHAPATVDCEERWAESDYACA